MHLRKVTWMITAFCLIFILFSEAGTASAASSVKVTIFKSAIEINGKKINNATARYPVLAYKGITYFPMSSDYAKALGMSTRWSKSKGLTIFTTTGSRTPLKAVQKTANNLNGSYSAQIASLSVQIDEVKLNLAKEKYPVLQFRDVTYFPMVSRFTQELFHWDVEGSAKAGYKIRSNQHPVFFQFVYDDHDFLYVNSGTEGMVKVSKKLDGKFEYTTPEESRTIWSKYELKSRTYALAQTEKNASPILSNEEAVYYGDQELVSLLPYKQKELEMLGGSLSDSDRGVFVDSNVVNVSEKISYVHLRIYYMKGIPAPHTPHEDHSFVMNEGRVREITGFNQWPDYFGKTPDGGFWISSYAPPAGDMTVGDFGRDGHLALVDKNGVSYNCNELLEAQDIDLLYADSQTLLIKAYNDRFEPNAAGKTDGIYSVDLITRKATKIANGMRGIAYVDNKKQVFTLDPATNTITNMLTKKSFRWWDYELIRDLR